jgi:hypothetical protein
MPLHGADWINRLDHQFDPFAPQQLNQPDAVEVRFFCSAGRRSSRQMLPEEMKALSREYQTQTFERYQSIEFLEYQSHAVRQ